MISMDIDPFIIKNCNLIVPCEFKEGSKIMSLGQYVCFPLYMSRTSSPRATEYYNDLDNFIKKHFNNEFRQYTCLDDIHTVL